MIAARQQEPWAGDELAAMLAYAVELRTIVSLRELAAYAAVEIGLARTALSPHVENGRIAEIRPAFGDRHEPESIFYRWRTADEGRFAAGRRLYEQMTHFSYHRVCGDEPHERND
jgi:hypothetical protein